jgi:hypothetical protein
VSSVLIINDMKLLYVSISVEFILNVK